MSEYKVFQHDVFLSYSRHDVKIMKRVQSAIESAGLCVWVDETNIPQDSDDWRAIIQGVLQSAACVVVILTPDAKKSEAVRQDIELAKKLDKQVFLLLARGDEHDSIPFGCEQSAWLDIRQKDDFYPVMLRITAQIHQKFKQKTPALSVEHDFLPVDSPVEPVSPVEDATDPLNWLRMLWWLFVTPEIFEGRTQEGWSKELKKAGSWLIGALVCGLAFIPVFGLSIGTLPSPSELHWLFRVLLLGSILFIPILYWAAQQSRTWVFVVVFGLATIGAGILASMVPTLISNSTLFTIAFIIAFSVVGIVAIVIKAIQVKSVVPIIVFVVAIGIVPGLVALFLAGGLALRMNESIRKQQASIWNHLIFALFLGSTGFMIWYCWLGGYTVLGGQMLLQ